jgi:two-component system, OmpR family, sensor histidine kinase BaeS
VSTGNAGPGDGVPLRGIAGNAGPGGRVPLGAKPGGATGSLATRLRAAAGIAPAWYAACVAALGAFAAVALVGVPAGAGLAALGAALCGLGMRRADGRHGLALWLLAAALAVTPAVRAAAWVWIPCLIGAALLASLAASGGRSGRQVLAGLAGAVRRPLLGVVATAAPLGRAAGRADGARLRPALRGSLLAAVLLAVFVPLFTAADAAFAELVDRALPSGIDVDEPVGRVVALAAVAALGGALAVVRDAGPGAAGAPGRPRLARMEWLLPLGSLAALFTAFVVVQPRCSSAATTTCCGRPGSPTPTTPTRATGS